MRRLTLILAGVALIACYASTFAGMAHQWWTDEDMSYGFIVPLVIAWIVWNDRAHWRGLPVRPNVLGFAVLLVAAFLQVASAFGAGLFAASLAFVLTLAGLVLALFGMAWLRAWTFPLVLTLFMLPKLAVVYNQVTLPLQLIATRLAGAMLAIAGFSVLRDGNILTVAGHSIEVVEACNGIRYLLPLAFLGLVIAYTLGAAAWIRAVVAAASVPIAILANALRVALSGLSPRLSEGSAHATLGVVIFVFSLALLGAISKLLAGYKVQLSNKTNAYAREP
jgi:exosortase